MGDRGEAGNAMLDQLLGYLNFSSGAPDPQFLANLNALFRQFDDDGSEQPQWRAALERMKERLDEVRGEQSAFRDTVQADAVLRLTCEHVLPGYLSFHADLLFHQTDRSLFNAFFVGRVFEAVLQQGGPWSEIERIVQGSIGALNDFIGHRPVAALQSQKIEPYAHEWVRPIPVYIEGAGAVSGRYATIVEQALDLLKRTDDDLLRAAYYDPAALAELAYDPRAYDFDHPVNRRPNYHFGQWDPHLIDNRGRYRRFVVQEVTLNAIVERVEKEKRRPRKEMEFEAAAVLAGTILMAAGVSGAGPTSHDSSVTLSSLLPRIAAYRDAFYERLIAQIGGKHEERLRKEAARLKQPFGGARQHLNAALAERRASQLERVRLAKVYARMGFPEAAARQADVVPVASARMLCRIDCRLTEANQAIDAGQLERCVEKMPQTIDLLKRAISCGAAVDPWNILGFDAQFSLFPALENSIRDHRVDELIEQMEQIFATYARLWSEAAAHDRQEVCDSLSRQFRETASWWRQFAAHEVSSVEATDPEDDYRAAEHVAQALRLWHQGGAAAGNVKFWAPHAEIFDSPQAYALVIEALLDRSDFVASMALLIHWLSQASEIGLSAGESSFQQLVERWLWQLQRQSAEQRATPAADESTWPLVRKFFDYLEANAEQYWSVPPFDIGGDRRSSPEDDALAGPPLDEDEEDDDERDDLYSAAYEDVIYRDSTADGVEGPLFETPETGHDELLRRAKLVAERLDFLLMLVQMWKLAAAGLDPPGESTAEQMQDAVAAMRHWADQAERNRRELHDLLEAIRSYRIPLGMGDHESMVQYDRQRLVKESLLEQTISTISDTADCQRLLLAAIAGRNAAEGENAIRNLPASAMGDDGRRIIGLYRAILSRDSDEVRRLWAETVEALRQQPLLYVPLSKGGDPQAIVAARVRQQSLDQLLAWLPRLGLLIETCQLLDTAREMEREHPVGPGAVTEFDEMFGVGYKAMVESLARSAESWEARQRRGNQQIEHRDSSQAALVDCLEQLTELVLLLWLAHSRTLRLSVLEKVNDKKAWERLVAFVKTYGDDLFTQHFLNLGNVRAILHQGVDHWLQQLQQDSYAAEQVRLIADLDTRIARKEAVRNLTLVLEAVVENYGEYRDYNSTTTQSDRGSMLYTLLDFLRLRSNYDRIAWNLKPVVWSHEILVRRGHDDAAKMWRRALAERIQDEADRFTKKLAALQRKYAMRMPSVADRVKERFVQPMKIDRLCALVEPAMREAGQDGPRPVFELLEHEIETLTRRPSGSGLDVPGWLAALEDEVERLRAPGQQHEPADLKNILPIEPLTMEETHQQLDDLSMDDD